jgi:hypothetical protein
MSIQELISHLAASDGRGEPEQDASGRLLFTEEQWRAHESSGAYGNDSSGVETKHVTSKHTTGKEHVHACKGKRCGLVLARTHA